MLKKILAKVNNIRIKKTDLIPPPIEYIKRYPINKEETNFIINSRETIKNIINEKDKRLMVIIGPCSIHDVDAAREYAEKLAKIRDKLADKLFIIMRVYFEKPRTTIGWKGLIYDPFLDNSFNMKKGLDISRHLLLDLAKMKIPSAVEYLDVISPQYFSDLITWGAIGARTTESQIHRELASGLSCPVGFKNGTDGNIQIAIDAVISASNSSMFWSVNKKGIINRYTTSGNKNCHIILRGGNNITNFDKQSIANAKNLLIKNKLSTKVMIDLSHANSNKNYKNQLKVGENIIQQLKTKNSGIFGVMIESNLKEGNQKINTIDKLSYGISITDACIGWNDSEKLLYDLAAAINI